MSAMPDLILRLPIDADLALHTAHLEVWRQALLQIPREDRDTQIVGVVASDLWTVIFSLYHRLQTAEQAAAAKAADRVRVQRLITYDGPRELVEDAIRRSLHGSRALSKDGGTISAVTLTEMPERVVGDGGEA